MGGDIPTAIHSSGQPSGAAWRCIQSGLAIPWTVTMHVARATQGASRRSSCSSNQMTRDVVEIHLLKLTDAAWRDLDSGHVACRPYREMRARQSLGVAAKRHIRAPFPICEGHVDLARAGSTVQGSTVSCPLAPFSAHALLFFRFWGGGRARVCVSGVPPPLQRWESIQWLRRHVFVCVAATA